MRNKRRLLARERVGRRRREARRKEAVQRALRIRVEHMHHLVVRAVRRAAAKVARQAQHDKKDARKAQHFDSDRRCDCLLYTSDAADE